MIVIHLEDVQYYAGRFYVAKKLKRQQVFNQNISLAK